MKSKLTTLIFLLILLLGCKKEQDPDRIRATLFSSKTIYENTLIGTWIEISKSEYEALASKLKNVTRSGTNEESFSHSSDNFESNTEMTYVQNDGNTLPKGSYLFAFKLSLASGSNTGIKVKLSSTAANSGFSDVGSDLPEHSAGEHYFVLKGNSAPTSDIGYLGIYISKSKLNLKNNIPGMGKYYYGLWNSNAPNSTPIFDDEGVVLLYQGLSTTTLQW